MFTPTRKDRIDDKLLAIESLAYNARRQFPAEDDKFIKLISGIGHAYKELDLFIKTPEIKGRKLGWWK